MNPHFSIRARRVRPSALLALLVGLGSAFAQGGAIEAPMQPIKKKPAVAPDCATCADEEAAVHGVADARMMDRAGPEFPGASTAGGSGVGGGAEGGSLVEMLELDRVGVSGGVAGLPASPTVQLP